jgi:hypothetical protein
MLQPAKNRQLIVKVLRAQIEVLQAQFEVKVLQAQNFLIFCVWTMRGTQRIFNYLQYYQ